MKNNNYPAKQNKSLVRKQNNSRTVTVTSNKSITFNNCTFNIPIQLTFNFPGSKGSK